MQCAYSQNKETKCKRTKTKELKQMQGNRVRKRAGKNIGVLKGDLVIIEDVSFNKPGYEKE